ncbi:hypothetical protein [Rhizobium sp. C1]|uniref:hypothetical protein n=1 Tax=Rhizobium sp. C1 TaxID=1349799 RepID=UPI001E637C52|nr:hypothetical protein [Rhizobium sp. C1]MCD2176653.1 hypothetical protein [Rhizobium sp. C1]
MERDNLRNSQDGETALESWLRWDVAPAYDAHKASPDRASSLEDAWKRFEARMDEIDREDN